MPDIRLPDGQVARFPDEMSETTIRGLIAQKYPREVGEAASAKPAAERDTAGHYAFDASQAKNDLYNDSWFAQITSGGNEGLANTLGAPVDIMNSGIGLGMRGINAVAGTALKPSAAPFGGSEFFKQSMGPAIRPETDDPGKQFGRRIAQSTGAAVVPALGAAATAAAPVSTALGVLGSGVGGGAAAATSQQVLPDNPTAEMIAEMVGSLGTAGATAALRRNVANRKIQSAVPDLDELRANKSAAYKRVDDMGVRYSPKALDDLVTGIGDEMTAGHINAARHPKAYSMLHDIRSKAITGQSPTLTELDQLRQVIRRDVASSADEAERFFGGKMIDNIDEFVDAAGAGQIVSGNASEGAAAIKTARDLNKRLRNYERITMQATKAERRAASTGSGGNIDNASRQNVRTILDNPRTAKFYSPDEKSAMDKIVMGTKPQNLARQVGKLSPGGNGLQQALALGATAYNPLMAAVPGVGMVSKAIADRSTRKGIEDLLGQIANGAPVPKAPIMDENMKRILAAVLATQASRAVAD